MFCQGFEADFAKMFCSCIYMYTCTVMFAFCFKGLISPFSSFL